MKEPRLEDISDYNTLKGEKKKVVWAVVLVGLLMGVAYMFVYDAYDSKADKIDTNDTIKNIPLR